MNMNLFRSDTAWKGAFRDAGLTLIKEEVQKGFPLGLYEVKMCLVILIVAYEPATTQLIPRF